jgi:hypothetical protein
MKLSAEDQIRMLRSVIEVRECTELLNTCIFSIDSKIKTGKVKYEFGSPESMDEIVAEVNNKLSTMDEQYKAMVMAGMIKTLVAYKLKSNGEVADDE